MDFDKIYEKYKSSIKTESKPVTEEVKELPQDVSAGEPSDLRAVRTAKLLDIDEVHSGNREKLLGIHDSLLALYSDDDQEKAIRDIEYRLGSLKMGETRIDRLSRYLKLLQSSRRLNKELREYENRNSDF